MPQTSWDDYRIAYHVADSGTLSKAGKIMNMNHATVLRHINRLEEALETKLFIRHQRGYQLTDAGELMIKELPNIRKSFIRLENLISSMEKDISGSLRITTVSDYSAMLNPALKEFRTAYPKLRIHIIATDVVLSLAEGSAHVSLRVGPRPSEPDLIVKKLKAPGVYFCASDDYLEQYGIPKDASDYKNHLWALPSEEKRHIPFVQKILKHISEEQIIYQSNSFQDIHNAVIEGMAIGPMNGYLLEQNKHLNQLDIPIQQEDEGLWFVYHKDLKNSVRIKTLYDFLVKSLE